MNKKIRALVLDAAAQMKEIADYVTKSNGGNGAVREFVEWIKGL